MLAQTKDNDKLVGDYDTNLLMQIQKTTVELSDATIAEKPPKYNSFVLSVTRVLCTSVYTNTYIRICIYICNTYVHRDPRPKHLKRIFYIKN